MTKSDVYVELTEDVQRIGIHFRYDQDDVAAVKTIRGRRFHGDDHPKFWSVPMDMGAARKLREIFGDRMSLGPALRAWAKQEVKLERNMRQLNAASDAKLSHTPQIIMDVIAGRPIEHHTIPLKHALRRKRRPRPYQRADIKLMSLGNVLNGNDVGTGKTLEVIGALYESEIAPRPVLVVAPRRTLVNVWQTEFYRLSDYECFASEMPRERQNHMELMLEGYGTDLPQAICLMADDLRVTKYVTITDRQLRADMNMSEPDRDPLHACVDYKGNWYKFKSELQRDFFNMEFGAFIIDEFQTVGLANRNSLFSIAANLVKYERVWPMSATPIGGKARRLWPILHLLEPKKYTSEWAWIDEYLEVTEDEIFIKGGRGRKRSVKTVGGIKPGTEQKFWEDHSTRMTRRVKKDALPGLPDAVEILVKTPMFADQVKEYTQFDEDHEIMLGDRRLTGSIVLTKYLRLRQMANYMIRGSKGKKWIAKESQKLDYLLERLDENGIRKVDYEPGARAYIGVLDKAFLTLVVDKILDSGIDCDRLDAGTKDSQPLIDRFNGNDPAPYVIAMTIQTGGSGLNLERAGSAHALDEDWNPDVMTQFFGRGDRGERDTALKCYTYQTPDSIQEYVAAVADGKNITNENILDYAKKIEAIKRA